MKKLFYLTMVLIIFCLCGLMLTASSTLGADIANTARITQKSQNINAIVGNTAIIKAIRGNQITLNAVNDSQKITNITVDNASIFKVGQQVDIIGDQLSIRRIASAQKVAPIRQQIATPEGISGGSAARITQASQNINAIVGNTAIIKAIRGNQITLNAVNDSRKITNITVDNVSIFKVGQQVDIIGNQLKLRKIATPEKGAPSVDMIRR